MGELLILRTGKVSGPARIFLPNGEEYKKPYVGPRVQVLRETHEAPANIQKRINAKVGLNLFGEPLYRVVWGWNRLDWCGGLTNVYDESGRFRKEEYGVFLLPKYDYLGQDKLNRWFVEKWMDPLSYGTPETWEFETQDIEGFQSCQALGPYPSRGEYEYSFMLEDPLTQEFLQLTPTIVDYTIETIEAVREMDENRKRELIQSEQARKEKAQNAELEDIWDDAAPAFAGVPNTTQANAPMRNTKSSYVKDAGKYRGSPTRGMTVA